MRTRVGMGNERTGCRRYSGLNFLQNRVTFSTSKCHYAMEKVEESLEKYSRRNILL